MVQINTNEYWESRYAKGGNSGNGSYGFLAEYKANFINKFIEQRQITSLLEYGCGDGNQLSLIDCDNIMAFDVSITALNKVFELIDCQIFMKFEDIKKTPDLVLSLDVIYHLVDDNVYNEYMNNMLNLGSKYLIIYSANDVYDNLAPHVKARRFTDDMKGYALINKEINPHKSMNHKIGSFSDFYIYEKNS